jgi:bifunctional non-homologous end joining protein LigD
VASTRTTTAKKASKKAAGRTARPQKAAGRDSKAGITAEIPRLAPKKPFPDTFTPMLATLADQPFDQAGWLYEIKWDGYRALAFMNKRSTELRSRNNKSFNEQFYPVYEAVKEWGLHAIVDGEIAVINDAGQSDFSALQQWRSEADGLLIYYVFDILWLNGYDLTGLPLSMRRAILEQQVTTARGGTIRLSESFDATGSEFFDIARQMGLEGIIAKRADSQYYPGERTRDWLKIKTSSRQEVVIGGYTKNEGSNKPFSSLLVGVFEKGQLHYTGKIGTGFNAQLQKQLLQQFKPLEIKKSPFTTVPDINKPSRFRPNPPKAEAVWLKPRLVCEVSFREMTSDGVMRHPSFEGMRTDKDPTQVTHEQKVSVKEVLGKEQPAIGRKILTPAGKQSRKTLLNPSEETQVREIGGHTLKFTNLSKVFWPKEKISKRDMLNYYYQVAPYMLPYMKDRPQSLNRHPNGINGKSFYQKDVTGKVPDWLAKFPYHSDADHRDKNFLVCTDEASLLYIASLGCIEMNPWSSRVQQPDNPDWCMIDLDPDKNTFDQVITAAQVTKKILDAAGVLSCCKTSGSTGLHIYIPLGAKYTYEQSKEFARVIVKLVHAELPAFTTIERKTADRQRKMYLDFLQNRPQATIAAPYSLRPKPGATVSMPLHWEEVKKGLQMKDFTIKNAIARIQQEGDLFKPVLGKAINMEKALKKLESFYF